METPGESGYGLEIDPSLLLFPFSRENTDENGCLPQVFGLAQASSRFCLDLLYGLCVEGADRST